MLVMTRWGLDDSLLYSNFLMALILLYFKKSRLLTPSFNINFAPYIAHRVGLGGVIVGIIVSQGGSTQSGYHCVPGRVG